MAEKTNRYFLRFRFHDLRLYRNGQRIDPRSSSSASSSSASNNNNNSSSNSGVHYLLTGPAEQRVSPNTIEMQVTIPPGGGGGTISLCVMFDKVFVPTEDFPPDVARGFDVRRVASSSRHPPFSLFLSVCFSFVSLGVPCLNVFFAACCVCWCVDVFLNILVACCCGRRVISGRYPQHQQQRWW